MDGRFQDMLVLDRTWPPNWSRERSFASSADKPAGVGVGVGGTGAGGAYANAHVKACADTDRRREAQAQRGAGTDWQRAEARKK